MEEIVDIGGNPIPMRLASSRWGLVDDDYLPPFQKHVYLPGSYVSGLPLPFQSIPLSGLRKMTSESAVSSMA